jgi:hypothetical protein
VNAHVVVQGYVEEMDDGELKVAHLMLRSWRGPKFVITLINQETFHMSTTVKSGYILSITDNPK